MSKGLEWNLVCDQAHPLNSLRPVFGGGTRTPTRRERQLGANGQGRVQLGFLQGRKRRREEAQLGVRLERSWKQTRLVHVSSGAGRSSNTGLAKTKGGHFWTCCAILLQVEKHCCLTCLCALIPDVAIELLLTKQLGMASCPVPAVGKLPEIRTVQCPT
jgi:hypothetical protein